MGEKISDRTDTTNISGTVFTLIAYIAASGLAAIFYGYLTADIQLQQTGIDRYLISEIPQRTINPFSGSIAGALIIIYGCGLGFTAGILAGFFGVILRVTSVFKFLLLGLGFGILSEYTGWVSWIYMVSEPSLLLFNPIDIFNLMQSLAEHGTFKTRYTVVNGIGLHLAWAAEALIIIGFSAYISRQFSEYQKQTLRS